MKSLLTLAALLLLLAPDVSATAVVAFRQPSLVVLASDSAEQTQRGDVMGHRRICKIRAAGRWFSTLAGFSSNEVPRLDVQALLTHAIAPTPTLRAAGEAITTEVYPLVRAALEGVRHTTAFAQVFDVGALVQSLIVAGTNADDPTTLRVGMFVLFLQAVEPFRLTAAWLECPGSGCRDGRLFYGATVDPLGPAIALLKPPRAAWVQRGDSDVAKRVIALQVAATPQDVQGPIDILELDAAGARWAHRDPLSTCAAINP